MLGGAFVVLGRLPKKHFFTPRPDGTNMVSPLHSFRIAAKAGNIERCFSWSGWAQYKHDGFNIEEGGCGGIGLLRGHQFTVGSNLQAGGQGHPTG
jgi:hypothetical protein